MPVIVDTSNLNGFCRKIASMPPIGRKAWDVMLYEVARILENCVRLTTRSNVERIKRSVEFQNRMLNENKTKRSPILYVTKAGLIWFADYPGAGYEGIAGYKKEGLTNQRGMVGGKTFHPMNEHFRYGDPRWNRYQQFLMDLKNKQIDVRGVIGRAGQTWVQMANEAGIQLQGIPAYITNAPVFRGNTKQHGFARKFQSADAMWLELVNVGKIVLGTIDGNRILQTSINGRIKYFHDNVQRGVFDDVKQIAQRYKGLIAA